jgi:hypothetical protein
MPRMLLVLLLTLFPLLAQEESPLDRRARDVARLIQAEPEWEEGLFDPSFLKQVPAARLRAIGQDYHGKGGKVVAVQSTQRTGRFQGSFDLFLEEERVVPMTLTLGEKPPHAVVGLWFGLPTPMLADPAAAVSELKKLPGRISFALWRLGEEEPEVLAELAPEESLAVGSACKLYVLGALVEEVAALRRKPADTLALSARHRSLPSGQLQAWPVGTPLTLACLAGLMISVSDNTATDHLLFELGRERVEALLEPMGNRQPERSRPFLATHELFRLKLTGGGKHAEQYLALEPEARRAFLEERLPSASLEASDLEHGAFSTPNRIDSLEWFASAADLARALDWLRRRTESGPAAPLRELLCVNRGLDVSREHFPWCGFKGGSEPGVLALAFLLRHADGSWYALAAIWNDPKQLLDEGRFSALVQRAIHLLGRSPGPR